MQEPFPTDGRVDLERVRLLLDVQTEYPSLDYKTACDLSSPAGKWEFAKDAAGMMSRPAGGYLVVGVDGRGAPVGHPLDPAAFDETRLRALLSRVFEGDFVLASQVHDLDGKQVAVVFFGRRPDGLFPVVRADFDAGDGGTAPLRAGDVFFRDGTQTRRWRSGDLPALLAPYVERIRQAERDQVGLLLAQAGPALRGGNAALGPLAAVTWRVSEPEFDATVAELSRRNDKAALRLLTLELRRDGPRLMPGGPDSDPDTLRDLLDRATSTAAYAVVLGDEYLLDAAVEALGVLFDSGCVGTDGTPRDDDVAGVWLDIAARVLGLVGLGVRLKEWWAVRPLVLHPVRTTYRRESWLRHALTWGYRTERVPRAASGAAMPGALVALARQTVARVPALRLDTGTDETVVPLGQPPAAVDPLLDSLCQADLLWCVVAAGTGGRSAFYPSFGSLYPHRTEPMVRALLRAPGPSTTVLPDQPADQVRVLVRTVLEAADHEGHWFGGWTDLLDGAG